MTLYSWHRDAKVLPFGQGTYFILWLACGHSAGMGKPGQAVCKRKCHACGGGYQPVVRAEARNG